MHPKDWRKSKKLTLKGLSALMAGISDTYLSEIERGVKPPSGRVLQLYFELSKKRVTPSDFPKKLTVTESQ